MVNLKFWRKPPKKEEPPKITPPSDTGKSTAFPFGKPPTNPFSKPSGETSGGSSGGGGGGSSPQPQSTLATPTAIATSKQDAQGFGTTQTQPQSYKQFVKQQYDFYSPYQATRNVAGVTYGNIRTGIKNVYDKATKRKEQEERVKMGFQYGSTEEKPFAQGQGTSITVGKAPPTTEELKRIAQAGDLGESRQNLATQEILRRKEEQAIRTHDFIISSENERLRDQAQANLNTKATELQVKVNDGSISVDEANKQLQGYADTLTKQNQENLIKKSEEFSNTYGDKLERETKKELKQIANRRALNTAIQSVPLVVAGGAVTGFVGTTSAIGATAVRVGAGVSAGVTAYQAIYQPESFKNLNREGILALGLSLAGFAVGAKVGAKVGGVYNQARINQAINNAKVDVTSKGVSKELQIKSLDIPTAEKQQLIEQLRSGASARVVEVKYRPTNQKDAKLIKAGLGDYKIRFIELTTEQGQVINRVAVGRIQTAQGTKVYKQDLYARGQGTEGEYLDLTLRGNLYEGKVNIREAGLIKTKSTSQTLRKADIGITKAQQEIFDVGKVKATTRKGLTNAQIEDLYMQPKAPVKIATGEQISFKKLTGAKVDIRTQPKIAIAEADYTGLNLGSYKPYKAPIKTTKKMDFSWLEDKPVKIKSTTDYNAYLKSVEPKLYSQQNIKQFEKSYSSMVSTQYEKPLSYGSLTQLSKSASMDLVTPDIYKGGIKGALVFDLPKVSDRKINLGGGSLSGLGLNVGKINKEQNKMFNNFNRFAGGSKPVSYQAVSPALNLGQLNKQIQQPKLKQQQKINFNDLLNPQPIIRTPTPFPFMADLKRSYKPFKFKKLTLSRTKKPKSYSATLGRALFQDKPFKVTKKEFRKLERGVYSGFEDRPVLELVTKKKKTKAKGLNLDLDNLYGL